jgi:hypothetical protein
MQFFFFYILLYFIPLGTKHSQTPSIYISSLQWENKFYASIKATDIITVLCCSLYFFKAKIGE